MEMKRHGFPACNGRERIGALFSFADRHTRIGGDFVCICLVKSEGTHQTEIVHLVLLGVFVQRMYHRGLCQPQAAEKADAERNDRHDRQKPAEAAPDLAHCHFQHPRHHSMLSTGTGASLRCTPMICPLLTRMTRSAIAVRAELWVMMTTVMPFSRLCFCKSARICLPVW